jgi:membrane protein required for colicin V production
MNWIDLIIGLVLAYSFYNGFKNGLILELTFVLALILGVFAAYFYASMVAVYLDNWLNWSAAMINLTAFILTFLIVVIVVNMLGKLISQIIGMIALGFVNKIAGGVFGILKVLLLIGIVFLVADAIKAHFNLFEYKVVQSSIFLDFFQREIIEHFPVIVDFIEEKANEIQAD